MNRTRNIHGLRSIVWLAVAALALVGVGLLGARALAQDKAANGAKPPAASEPSEEARMEYKANDMINKAQELFDMKQEERGIKLLQSVPEMYPKAKARFKAYLAMAREQMKSRQYELAIKQLVHLADSENPDEQAEGLFQMGLCYYNLSSYDRAFMALRRVTNEYAWTIYANDAYFYIGDCHKKMGRYAKAIEALEMVGTAVTPDEKGDTLAEAGQRLYVKVSDKDLVVLRSVAGNLSVTVAAKSGDKEQVALSPLGPSGEYYIGSIQTVLGPAKPGDGTLQIRGGDTVAADYLDRNTQDAKLNVTRLATVRMVSTATAGFTDGAYREYTHGIFGDNEAFVRVKDLDRDVSDERDSIKVKLCVQYKLEKEEAAADKTGVDLTEQPEYVQRDQMELALTETEPHSGIFVGTTIPRVVADKSQVNPNDGVLQVMKGDDVVVQYVDEAHIGGFEPRTVTAKAKLLIGQIQDVMVITRKVDDLDLRARKNLIEARILLKLAQIFKDVGLVNKAAEKGDEGLDRVNDVISTGLKASLDRKLVEEAFNVKWDLLLAQDKLGAAIEVCQSLMQLFPDSSLADKALLKIAQAKADGENPGDAIGIYAAVTQLPKSDLKAEAQYNIGLLMERMATADAERSHQPPALASAMQAYKACADNYPDSSFAGDSLGKIANYYIITKDYARAIEFIERVFQDYPDASFLDKMLLKWGVAAYSMGDAKTAQEKLEQLLSEYPNSTEATKARTFLDRVNKKDE